MSEGCDAHEESVDACNVSKEVGDVNEPKEGQSGESGSTGENDEIGSPRIVGSSEVPLQKQDDSRGESAVGSPEPQSIDDDQRPECAPKQDRRDCCNGKAATANEGVTRGTSGGSNAVAMDGPAGDDKIVSVAHKGDAESRGEHDEVRGDNDPDTGAEDAAERDGANANPTADADLGDGGNAIDGHSVTAAIALNTDRHQSARVSHDSESLQDEEEDDDDMDEDMSKPWVKPSKARALAARKRLIWNEGMRSYFSTTVEEMGSMGVGLYLYFWVIRIVAISFLVCTVLSVPAIVLNAQGNAGMATADAEVDSLKLVLLSYGNQGVDPDLTVESSCISNNGTVDCTGKTVQVSGETWTAADVGFVLAGGEIVIAFFLAAFIMIVSDRMEAKIDEIDESNATPADYAVMVRGLPHDVTKDEVREHFDQRYSLTRPGPLYPFLGVSVVGVGVFWASTLGLMLGVLVAPSVVVRSGVEGLLGFGVGLLTLLLCMLLVFVTIEACSMGKPRPRDTPQQAWEKEMKLRRRREGSKSSAASKYATARVVVPLEAGPEGKGDMDAAVEAGRGKADVANMEAGVDVGVASSVEQEDEYPDEQPPDPLPCQNCSNSHDRSFIGSWVADVVLGNPVGEVLRGFLDREEAFRDIRKARVVVRQMKTLDKAKKLAKAEARLAKLQEKEEALMNATRKKRDPAAFDKVTVAFVTFEHPESKKRCLEDYRYSRSAYGRYFQPKALQFCRRPVKKVAEEEAGASTSEPAHVQKPSVLRWKLKVFQARAISALHGTMMSKLTSWKEVAPEPSDVKWENLDVTPMSRKLRRAVTSFVCIILLVISFVIIYLAQNEQGKLQAQIPALDTCEETVPAVIFGTYDFPSASVLQRNETLDATCDEGSFYLAFTADADGPDDGMLDYGNLSDIHSADGSSVSRAAFEGAEGASLCDEACSPTSGGRTCSALSCYETSWKSEGFDCVTYPQSTTVGCFCLEAVVSSLRENGVVAGARKLEREQGAICAPFFKDYAQAYILNVLAILAVVIVNTLLTSVMGKLARFERHVSLSDYTSTVTAKLAVAQFLNTAIVVIIVNAGYTGGGLDFLQDMGVLAGEHSDFDRAWYATVGVAVAVTMLLNVVVPHVGPLVGSCVALRELRTQGTLLRQTALHVEYLADMTRELVVKRFKRLVKGRSAATQAELNDLYKPPPFSMESRYAFLLQVLGVSMMYSGGIPILYLFAAFSLMTSFLIDKLWIIKLTQQPPMFTAALARMFVRAMPLVLLVHMALTTYMLGNANILNVGFVSEEAEAIAKELHGEGISGLVADHVLRKHAFALFVFTLLFVGLYVAYSVVGDPLLRLIKDAGRGRKMRETVLAAKSTNYDENTVHPTGVLLVLGTIFKTLLGAVCKEKPRASVVNAQCRQPGFTAEYFRVLKGGEKLESDEIKMGWNMDESGKTANWLFVEDGNLPRGVKAKRGLPRRTWQAIAALGQYNYVMEDSDECGMATRYMATAGFLSPRMKERDALRKQKIRGLTAGASRLDVIEAQDKEPEPEGNAERPAPPPLVDSDVNPARTSPEQEATNENLAATRMGGPDDGHETDPEDCHEATDREPPPAATDEEDTVETDVADSGHDEEG